MSFNFIYNPLTNEKYSIFSYEGKSLLKQYIKDYPEDVLNHPKLVDIKVKYVKPENRG